LIVRWEGEIICNAEPDDSMSDKDERSRRKQILHKIRGEQRQKTQDGFSGPRVGDVLRNVG
jgi:hypothetical protein